MREKPVYLWIKKRFEGFFTTFDDAKRRSASAT